MPESVHLTDYPTPDDCRDEYLERQMQYTMTAVSLGRFIRTNANLKVRQPLAKAVLAIQDAELRKMVQETSSIIAEELNVKSVEFCADEEELVHRSCKANFKALGARLGKDMKIAAAKIAQFTSKEIGDILSGTPFKLTLPDGTEAEITAEDLVVHREEKPGLAAASEGGVTVALSTLLTPELEAEGFARELVSKLQNIRKERQFQISDRITVRYQVPAEFSKAIETFREYIANETLASTLEPGEGSEELNVNGVDLRVSVEKA